jgi:hypothetical protein
METSNLKFASGQISKALISGDISAAIPVIIDLILIFGREIPADMASELDATGCDWRYYYMMIFYAVKWHRMGFAPGKLKNLMDEAISEMKVVEEVEGAEGDEGKRTAMTMFKNYLKYKREIDSYLASKS